MNRHGTRNIAASVRQRLLNFARASQEEFQGVLTRYALERLLYKAVLQRPLDEVQLMVSQMNLAHLPPEDALKQVIRVAIAYEATNPHRQMLWFQEASQNQGLYFKQGNWWSL